MKRRWTVLASLAVALFVLLGINAIVLDSQTRRAEVTSPGARIVETSSTDLQVLDAPPAEPRSDGSPIVLLHCYGCSMRWWDRLAPLLETSHRVIRIDLVGHGGSAKPKSGYSISDQAGAVAEALNQLEVERATVVGHSMGGAVAVALAERASELVDRVVVIGTASSHEASSLPFIARLSYVPVLGEALWRLRFGSLVKSGYGSAFAPGFDLESGFENPDQVVADSEAMTYSAYDSAPTAADEFAEEQSLASRVTAIGVPLLAILGADDQIVDTPQTEEDYAAVPGATVRVFDGVGHSPNVEAPEDTAETILRFAGAGADRGKGNRRRG